MINPFINGLIKRRKDGSAILMISLTNPLEKGKRSNMVVDLFSRAD